MSSHAHAHQRPFLDVAEAETTADLGALRDTLSKAAHDAEVLGLSDVREHLNAALVHAVQHAEDENET